MIKKKGTLSFKPKAPQSRRQPGAPQSATPSTRQSIEPQSHLQTSAPTARPAASSPPPAFTQQKDVPHGPPSRQDAIPVEEAVPILSPGEVEDSNTADTVNVISSVRSDEIEDFARVREPLDRTVDITGDGNRPASSLTTATTTHSQPLDHPTISHQSTEFTDLNVPLSENPSTPENDDLSILGPGESEQAAEVVPTAGLNPDGTSDAVVSPALEKAAKRPSKRRKLDQNGSDVRQSIEVLINKPRRERTRPGKPRRQRESNGEGSKRRQRKETPEDAEEQEIDHSTVKMADLTKDLRIGKKFSRHAEIKKREVEKRLKAKLTTDHQGLVQGHANEVEAPPRTAVRQEEPPEAIAGPQMRIVNGQIVIDDASLVVDRHAMAAAAATDMEEVEEDDFSRITTSGTFMKRERNIYWDAESTEKFYNGLRMFGTDFEMISKMFPNRNRRQIKLKFNKEERDYPRKVYNALMGEAVKIDFEEYKSQTGLEYETSDDIKAQQAQIEAEHVAEQLRMRAEADEATRQKKAEIQRRANPAVSGTATAPGTEPASGVDSAKENEPDASVAAEGRKASAASKSKRKPAGKKKKRNLHSVRGGGEEVEVLGTIDDLQA